MTQALRSILVATVAILGVLGFSQWAPERLLTFYWLGLAVLAMVLGAAFRESRYRWAALLIYFVAIGRAYAYDLINLGPLYQFLSFAALCVPLLIISWAYSRYRIRHLGRLRAQQGNGAPSDG